MIRGGFNKRKDEPDKFIYKTDDILRITKSTNVSSFIQKQQRNYAAHLARTANNKPTKQLMFNNDKLRKRGNHAPELLQQVLKQFNFTRDEFLEKAANREF